MIDRRQMIAGAAALVLLPKMAGAAMPVLPVPASNRMSFDIIRKGSKLGSHALSFTASGADLTVTVAVELIYRLGPLVLYRYEHHAQERWQQGRIIALDTHTSDNGTRYQVNARREGAALMVESSTVPYYIAPADALPATHWNVAEMRTPWINPQDGKLLRPHVARGGTDELSTGLGPARASRYTLSGDAQLDIWYDPRLGWVALSFAKGGSVIRYLRKS